MTRSTWPQCYPHVFPTWPPKLGFSISPGWEPLLHELCAELEEQAKGLQGHAPAFEVVQVKQKCGALRVYAEYESVQMRRAIEAAQVRSRTICEVCGDLGHGQRVEGYLVALCTLHYEAAKSQGLQALLKET